MVAPGIVGARSPVSVWETQHRLLVEELEGLLVGKQGAEAPLLHRISRFETGSALQHLDTLQYWARVLGIPAELLWFDMPGEMRELTTAESVTTALLALVFNGVAVLSAGPQANGAQPVSPAEREHTDDSAHDSMKSPSSPMSTTARIESLIESDWMIHNGATPYSAGANPSCC